MKTLENYKRVTRKSGEVGLIIYRAVRLIPMKISAAKKLDDD